MTAFIVAGYCLVGLFVARKVYSAMRAKEIRQWCASQHFQRVTAPVARAREIARCPKCGREVRDEWQFCMRCGATINAQRSDGTEDEVAR